MTPGPVAAVRPDSPGSKAGFLAGDVITSVEGKSDYNPMRLPDMAYAMVGKRMTFQVRRTIRDHTEDVTVVATPDDSPVWAENVENVEPLEIPGLGIAIIVTPKVAAVVPGSPAEKAKIKPGDVIATIQFAPPKPESGDEEDEPEVEPGAEPKWQKAIKLDGSQSSWPWVFDVIQGSPEPVRFELANGKAVMMTPQPVPDWFSPMRDINFYPLTRIVPPQPFGVAVVKGWRDTQNMALSIFGLIRSWIQGRLGGDSIGGPVKIGEIAFKVAKFGGLASFMRFLGLLSVNLAVINFLPIPPLDGGQMTFLIAEKIRGKPLPENAVAYPTIAGLIFVFVVFVLVFFKDVLSYF